jgi:Zn-dependent M32 family carboxypeptidase
VHEVGSRASAEQIVTSATGRGLDAAAYFRHLEAGVVSLHRGRAA